MSLAALYPHIWRWICQCVGVGIGIGAALGFAAGRAWGEPLPAPERGPELVAAIASAQAGAVLELEGGTYTAPVGGFRAADRPGIVLRAAPGARVVLVPGRASPAWTPVEGAPGVYRTPGQLGSGIYRSDGRWTIYARDRALFDSIAADGIDVALRGPGETLISLGGDDPRELGAELYVGAAEAATLVCDRSQGLRLEGLEFRHAGGEAVLLRAGCDRAEIVDNDFRGGRFAVRAFDPQLQDVVLERNRVVGPVRHPKQCYRDEKGTPLIEGGAFSLPGIRPVIRGNTIRSVFDGIGLFCRGCSTVDPLIEANDLEDVRDDAFELDGAIVRGLVQRNRVRRAFVGISASPRVSPTGEDLVIRGNALESAQVWGCFDRTGATTGSTNVTKFNGAPAVDMLFEGNSLHGEGHVIRGAVAAGGPYPMRVRWIGNLIHSRFGPLVRFPGLAADGNVLEGNTYVLGTPTGAAFIAWNQAPGSPVNFPSLELARASAAGQSAGWESEGAQVATLEAAAARGPFPDLVDTDPPRPGVVTDARIVQE